MNEQLAAAAQYIREHMAAGHQPEALRQHFLQSGWTAAHIDEAFHLAGIAIQGATQQPPGQILPDVTTAQRAAAHHAGPHQSPDSRYSLRRSFTDAWRAIRFQPGSYALCLLSAGITYVLSGLLIGFLNSHLPEGTLNTPVIANVAKYVFVIGLYYLVSLAISVYYATTVASVLAASTRKERVSFSQAVQRFTSLGGRAYFASLRASFIIFLPLIIAAIFDAAAAAGTGFAVGLVAAVNLILVIGGLAWGLILSLRLTLVTQVAFLEPNLPRKQIFSRSNFLLDSSGQWFVVRGVLLLILVGGITAFVRPDTGGIVGTFNDALSIALTVISAAVAQASLTMLYLHKDATRGQQPAK